MSSDEIRQLDQACVALIQTGRAAQVADALKAELEASDAPFVGRSVPLSSLSTPLPPAIRSCWLFRLRRGVWSGCHFHPNSVQHMLAISGTGLARVGGMERPILPGPGAVERWFVIPAGVPHEFLPDSDITVISFHTCEAEALEEVDCATGSRRHYEPAAG